MYGLFNEFISPSVSFKASYETSRCMYSYKALLCSVTLLNASCREHTDASSVLD